MARWRWPSLRGQKALAIGLDPVTAQFLRLGTMESARTPASALNLYEKSSAMAGPVQWIASGFSSIQPVIQNLADGAFSRDDPILDLLRRPSPFYSGKRFREHLAINAQVTGESGMVASGVLNRPPVELVPISPKDYEPRAGQDNIPVAYTISGLTRTGTYNLETMPGNRVRWVADSLREFRQIRNFSTQDNGLLRGQSPFVSASNELRQHILGGDHNVSLLEKGGRTSMIFRFNRRMSPDQFKEEKKRILENYGGASQAGAIAVVAGEELDIKEIGATAKDMDFVNLQNQARMALLMILRVPLSLAFLEAATLDNYRVGKIGLFDDAVLPLFDLVFDDVSDFLLPRFGRDPQKERITYDIKTIRALETRMLEQLKTRKEIGIETIDELRTSGLGREPYDPDEDATAGEVIYASSSLVPIGMDPLAPSPFAEAMADGNNPFAPSGDGDGDGDGDGGGDGGGEDGDGDEPDDE